MTYTDRFHSRGMGYEPLGGTDARAAAVELAVRAVRAAEHVCVLTSERFSAESGPPNPGDAENTAGARCNHTDVATVEAFQRNPNLVWSWYATRAREVRNRTVNEGHYAMKALALHVPHVTLMTLSADDMQACAGNEHVVALHGSPLRARCSSACGSTFAFADAPQEKAPKCKQCGSLMRPDVVWPGESLAPEALSAARSATFACDVFLALGTASVVEPAASLPWLAAAHGATVIVVDKTMDGQRQGPSIVSLRGSPASTFSRLVTQAFAGRKPRFREE
jgi:NAD-dependent deacetylase